MIAIICASGAGTRLYPINDACTKSLLPVYDKPAIYYNLSLLINNGVKHVIIVALYKHIVDYQLLLGNGTKWGIKITYVSQAEPNGVVDALHLGLSMICDNSKQILLMLGDNIFINSNYNEYKFISMAAKFYGKDKNLMFTIDIGNKDYKQYGCYNITDNTLLEKPQTVSNVDDTKIITGLYVLNQKHIKRIKNIVPDSKGEKCIVDVLNYLFDNSLLQNVYLHNFEWYDIGNCDEMLNASIAVKNNSNIGYLEFDAIANKYVPMHVHSSIIDYQAKSQYSKQTQKLISTISKD